jgi:uncharacterized protein (TIGR03086 family)
VFVRCAAPGVSRTLSAVTARGVDRVGELIELGRDREAAELGVFDDDRGTMRGGSMDVLSQLDELGPLLSEVIQTITPEDLDRTTPCADFTVRGVLEHMVAGATAFAAGFRGTEAGAPDTSDVLGAVGPALSELMAAVSSPGALDRTIAAPFGDLPGATFARFVVLDGLVHGWDLARAIGRPYEPSDALVAEVRQFAEEALAPLRDGTTFADPIEAPASATPIDQLAAFTGRRC